MEQEEKLLLNYVRSQSRKDAKTAIKKHPTLAEMWRGYAEARDRYWKAIQSLNEKYSRCRPGVRCLMFDLDEIGDVKGIILVTAEGSEIAITAADLEENL